VSIDALTITAVPGSGSLTAVPAPSARTGRPSLFTLTLATAAGPRRAGSAVALLGVVTNHWRATRDLLRGDTIEGADIEAVRGSVDGALKRLPERDEIVAARTVRSISAGESLTAGTIVPVPLVRSGQTVRVWAMVGQIRAEGVAVAAQSGGAGARIRVVNPESRRVLLVRVVGIGEVEVVHGL
jgi:flagella basal body P-ring formation protein FlgA